MAGKSRIAGITIEIGGDTTELTKSLKGVDSELKNTTEKLRDVNKLLKLDPGNTDLLKQKQKALADAISETKDRLTKLKEAQKQVKEGTSDWDALQREIIETEKNLESLEQEYKDFGSVAAQQVALAGEKMQSIGDGMAKAGRSLSTYVTAPLVAAGTVGAKKYAEVDKTMQLVNSTMAKTGETEEDAAKRADLLSQAMKDAAANSVYGMSDAANAMLNFARAGLSAEQAAATIAPAMNLAAGEGGELDTVSAGLVATINGFHGSFDEAAHYADVFANACNNSALDVNSLSNAMSIAAPIFSAAGYNVNDAALYMGVMANNGIEANKAANSLKTGIARLVSPTDEAAKQLKALDWSITNADGTMKDSVQIQKELHDKFMALSESEQIAAASAIFGKNQMAPWLALINAAPEDVNALSKALTDQGTTTEMAAAMMSGFGGSIEKLKSSIDVAATSLGEALAPIILKVADAIQKAVDWFNKLDKDEQEQIVKIGLIIAALGPLLLVGGKLISGLGSVLMLAPKIVTAVGGIISIVTKIGTAVSGLLAAISPTTILIAVIIAAVIALTVVIVKNWDKISEWTKKTWEGIRETIAKVWQNISSLISKDLSSITGFVTNSFNRIVDGIRNKMNQARDICQSILTGIARLFKVQKWELPRIKLPHFHVEDGKTIMGITLPKISVDWYRKAYENPYLFTSPTVVNGRGFGDGGGSGELVYGRDQLMRDIAQASSGSVTINVYASEGMNVNQLADKIQQRLAQVQQQRIAAYA